MDARRPTRLTLNDLAAEPEQAATLTPEERRALLVQALAAVVALASSPSPNGAPPASSRLPVQVVVKKKGEAKDIGEDKRRKPRAAQHVVLDAHAERAIRVAEAAAMLRMTKDFVHRHWKRLGFYKDDDGHLKVALSTLVKHIEQRSRASSR